MNESVAEIQLAVHVKQISIFLFSVPAELYIFFYFTQEKMLRSFCNSSVGFGP